MTLLQMITAFMADRHMSETRFGREAIGDPRFVRDLKRGRVPRARTEGRVRDYVSRSGGAL